MSVRRAKLASETHDLGYLRLYREDLRAIASAVAEVGDIAIDCDGYEATAPDDFSDDLPIELDKVIIAARKEGTERYIESKSLRKGGIC